jgi:hypothetical protein
MNNSAQSPKYLRRTCRCPRPYEAKQNKENRIRLHRDAPAPAHSHRPCRADDSAGAGVLGRSSLAKQTSCPMHQVPSYSTVHSVPFTVLQYCTSLKS